MASFQPLLPLLPLLLPVSDAFGGKQGLPLLKARTLVLPYPAAELAALQGSSFGMHPEALVQNGLRPRFWEETSPGFSPTLNAQSATEIERW